MGRAQKGRGVMTAVSEEFLLQLKHFANALMDGASMSATEYGIRGAMVSVAVDELRSLRATTGAMDRARAALQAAQTALYDAMFAGHLSRAYHDSVIVLIEQALHQENEP